jgi:hypothetical protein
MRVARLAVVASLFTSFLCSLPSRVDAQVISATLRGTVHGADDGTPMAEVEVTLVNEATGDIRTATTNADGAFAFTNLQVGGPYHVTANFAGFKPVEEKGITLNSSRTRDVDLGMRLQEEVIEVSGNAIARNTSNRTVVTAAEIDELPSVNRDPRDVVRRNPEVTVEGGARALSIGGANNRYNSITIDGIRQDDDFGLNASGYPTRRSPIALSAIQELAVDSSPFDVRYGKFLGGNVNIVTKSGTNEFKGTLFGTYASDALLGSQSGPRTVNVDYRDLRYGATVGGPIIKDKLHFLASIEGLRSTSPISNGPMGSGAAVVTTKVTAAEVQMAQDIANGMYNFDPGVAASSGNEHDLKLLGKLDWTISPEHRASVTYQRTGGNAIQLGNAATTTSLPLSSSWYDAQDTLNTFSGRVTSDWTDQLSTELEADAKLVSSRVPSLNGDNFMSATINTPEGGNITLGPDISRHSNLLDNNVLHGKATASYLAGINLIQGGIEYERTYIDNLFIQRTLGDASYANFTDFMNMRPSQIRYANSTDLIPADAAANWNVGLWTAYAQDQIKITPDLTVQAGARFEQYQTGARPVRNQIFVDRYADQHPGLENNGSLEGRNIIEPRAGVTWTPLTNLNVRAGTGLYSGGTPAVWMSNNYTNDGLRTFSVTCNNGSTLAGTKAVPNAFCPDPSVILGFNGRDIPQAMKNAVMNGGGNGNVDVLDPNFKIPSVWKIGAGADYALDIPGAGDYGKDLELRANYTFTKVREGVNWIDLRRDLPNTIIANNQPIGETVDGRPLYPANYNTTRGVDMELTNDNRGYGHVASMVAQKAFPFGLFVGASYAYTDNQEVNPGTSSVSTSNYGIVAVTDPNHPDLAVSNYQRRHRATGALEYSYPIVGKLTDDSPWKNMKTSFGLFTEVRSGQPYSWTFAGRTAAGAPDGSGNTIASIFGEDAGSISFRNRELFYVPTDAETCVGTFTPGCKVILANIPQGTANSQFNITKAQFNAFLDHTGLSAYRGKIAPRNALNGPHYARTDVRLAQDLPNPLSGQRARLVIDIENFGNLLNHNWGIFRQVQFPYYTQAVDVSVDRTSGAYVYSNLRAPNPTQGPQTADVLLSVWRLSLGLMYDF